MNRDTRIDNMRGFAMLWVIFVHVLYWANFVSFKYFDIIKSFCLFEMPIFFFVTGASNSLSKENNYFRFVFKRYKQCLVPYWIFAFICATLSAVKCIIDSNDVLFSIKDILYSLKIFFSWALPIDKQITSIPYLTWALWFISVYLVIVLIIPFLLKANKKYNPFLILSFLIFLFFVSVLFKLGWIQNVFFYLIWVNIGIHYKEILLFRNKKNNLYVLFGAVIASLIILFIMYKSGYSLNMQNNKFPPNFGFFVFSFFAMTCLLIMYPLLNNILSCMNGYHIFNKVFEFYSQKSMLIFLYQAFAFNISIRAINLLLKGTSIGTSCIKAVLCFAITIPLCIAFAILLDDKKITSFIVSIFIKYKGIVLYFIFGGCTVLINIATYYLFYNVLSLSNVCSNIIAWVVAVLFAFITNKIWVFNSKSFDKKIIVKEIASFTTCRLTTGIIDLIIMYLSVDVFLQNEIIWKIISNIIVIILNYVASKILVFKNIKK